jgi:DNA glycosylase AlkZ-like
MPQLSLEHLNAYRAQTFRTAPGKRLTSREEAVEFVKQRGFVYFWPISGIVLPSLWAAVAGDRPVADDHDDPGHATWGWKDSLLGQRQWYYAKVLRKRATMIAFDAAPYFYALSENYGAPDEDYLTLYEQGRMPLETRTVYEVVLDKGPIDTVALRKAAHMTSRDSNTRFERALADLQADFKIVPVGVTQAGAWHYSFAYDVVHRVYPDLLEQARFIGELNAQQKLVELYFRSVGAAQARDIIKLFGWRPADVQQAVDRLENNGLLQQGVEVKKQGAAWIALRELLDQSG